jgi:hypothetical protein
MDPRPAVPPSTAAECRPPSGESQPMPATRRTPLQLACLVCLVLVGLPLATAGRAAPGDGRSEPVPLGEEAEAGPWRMAVLEVLTGGEATDLVAGASAANEPPRDGFTYVAVRLRATNAADRPFALHGDDFALTGASGLVRRSVGAQPPDPPLDGVVEPGEEREGWVVLGAPAEEADLLLVYDSLTIPGLWADRVFALEDGAAVADAGEDAAEPDEAGTDPARPVGAGEAFTTAEWRVELVEVVRCGAVFDLVDFRTGALGAGDASNASPWVALRVRVTNARADGAAAYLPAGAFMLAGPDGNAVPDVLTLTPPDPDATGAYYPTAGREGWVAFEIPEDYKDTGVALVRFLPYRTDSDPRYLTYGATEPGAFCG